jgi:hypothetical protein
MITENDISLYKSFENSASSNNGGPLTTKKLESNTIENIFKNIGDLERLSGSTKYAKVFWKLDNLDNTSLTNAFMYMSRYTPGGDYITYFLGTVNDTQLNITGSERYYGAAPLLVNVSAGSSQIIAKPEHSSISEIIKTGDSIVITNGTSWERHDNITTLLNNGNIEITLSDTLVNSFNTADTSIASICPIGTITGSTSNPIITSINGRYDNETYSIEHRNKGGLEQIWTLTFTNTTQYSCRGNTVGYVGMGSTVVDFAPINTALDTPYFMLRKAGFNNLFREGDTMVFTTHPAAQAVWFKRTVPAATISVSNLFEFAIHGESA